MHKTHTMHGSYNAYRKDTTYRTAFMQRTITKHMTGNLHSTDTNNRHNSQRGHQTLE